MTETSGPDHGVSGAADWITALGIRDLQTGHEKAIAAREMLFAAGRAVLSGVTDYAEGHVVFSGLLARGQGLYEGSIAAIDANNPYSAFTLIRAYAENAAAILYLRDHPTQLSSFWRKPGGVAIGRITNHARTRFDGFPGIYNQLSQYAHPAPRSLMASMTADTNGLLHWASAPRFKSESDALVAYAWVVELTIATSHLLRELGDLL